MELKLVQYLASVNQNPIFLVFIDIQKVSNNLDWGIILQALECYEEEPKLQGLLEEFWSRQEVVTCQNGFHVP